MKKLLILSTVFTFFVVVTASAQGPGDRARRANIERGFDRGQLTRPEKFRLQKNHAQYNVEKRRAFRDGRISPSEKRRLHKMSRQNRKETYRAKHNGRRRHL
jgi:hypothetical protein